MPGEEETPDRSELDFHTRAVGAVGAGDEVPSPPTGDVVAPIHLATTHRMDRPGEAAHGYKYARFGNPTRDDLEARLARLEGGSHATAFASGTAAISTACLALLTPGDHVVAFESIYGGTRVLLDDLFEDRLDVAVDYVDATDPRAVGEAIRPETALVWMESPTNPLLRLCDLSRIAGIADRHGVPLGVDNTFSSPYVQRPLALGADLVVHSTTKYLNGHSDSLGGAVVTDDREIHEAVARLQSYDLGNPLAPFDAFLVRRGLKTLPLRVDRQEANAMRLATVLDDHDAVRRVRYPGLPSHPQHDLASEQMTGYGGVVSFELDATGAETTAALERLDVFTVAVSLGGVESLVEQPATMSASYLSEADRRAAGISESLVRAPVGVESADDLVADLRGALAPLV